MELHPQNPTQDTLLPVPLPPEAPTTHVPQPDPQHQPFEPPQAHSQAPEPPRQEGQPKKKQKNPRQRVRWTQEEEMALRKGVTKYGAFANCWAKIKQDVELGEVLSKRSNVDLKDKWRNTKNHANKYSTRPKRIEDLQPEMRESGWSPHFGIPYNQFQKIVVEDVMKVRGKLVEVVSQINQCREHVPGRPDGNLVPASLLNELEATVKSLQYSLEPPHPSAAEEQAVQAAVMAAAAAAAVSENLQQQQNDLHMDQALPPPTNDAALALQALPLMGHGVSLDQPLAEYAKRSGQDPSLDPNKRYRRA